MSTEPRRPNFFLVGAQKSGTTTLAVMLAQHPEVFMCTPKEPGYLAFGKNGYTALDGRGRAPRASRWVIRSLAGYLDLFASAPASAAVLGDASTWYLSEPGCAETLQRFNPDARIVAILRQPAHRAYSAWSHARRDDEEPYARFEEALAAEHTRHNASHLLRYREMGAYARQISDYLRVFGRDRVLILFYDDLRDRPESVWQSCCEFLRIAALPAPTAHQQNRSGEPRSRVLHQLLRSERFKRCAKSLLPLSCAAWLKGGLDALILKRFPAMAPETRRQLTAEFEPDIRELERLTGRDLRHWRYRD